MLRFLINVEIPEFVADGVSRYAERNGIDFEEAFNEMLADGIGLHSDRLEHLMTRH